MTEEHAHKHQAVHDFLTAHPMGVLSTVDENGTPWGSAVYCVADEDFNFYFVTRIGTLKYKNIKKSPVAALTIVDAASQTTVQLTGKISKIPAKDYVKIVFDKLYASIKPKDVHGWAPPLAKIHEGNYMPLCLTPTMMHFADYQKPVAEFYTDYIETIIPS